jgi:predicted transcriptional regulator of viral defense system
MTTDWLTTTAVCGQIPTAAPHQVRRAIDALEREGKLTAIHAGNYRLVKREDIETLRNWLLAKGWIRNSETVAV